MPDSRLETTGKPLAMASINTTGTPTTATLAAIRSEVAEFCGKFPMPH